jgi:putative pyoverdin transport system ATP-binding/permease protein
MTKKPSAIREILRLLPPFWPVALISVLMGGLSGLATAGLIAIVNNALQAGSGTLVPAILAFAGLCLLALAGEIVSDIGTNTVGQRIVARLRQDLSAKILTAPIARIEEYRAHRLIAVLNADIETVSNVSFLFSAFAIALAVTLGCLIYLLLLSPALFPLALGVIFAGAALQIVARSRGLARFTASREAEDELQKHYRAVIDGAKELRISRPRRSRLFAQITATVTRIRELRLQAVKVYCTANAFGAALVFIVIGVILALQQAADADRAVLSGFALVLLYMKSPVQQLVGALPVIARAQVAFSRIAELSSQFANPEPHLAIEGPAAASGRVDSIVLAGVRHAFPAPPGGAPFVLGPVDLTIRRGEIVFIVGENGCGKTTLIKLILGLYPPQRGEVMINGEVVTPDRRDDYRQLFSAVFFDYHLFSELMFAEAAATGEVDGYLEQLDLAGKTRIVDGAFSTTDLSTGQRKRLALIQVYLEQRPVLVFDEWAAEQDPTFRAVFYNELLPDLRRRGKTLVVVSHDDRYFHVADRCIRLHAGRVVEERRAAPAAPALSGELTRVSRLATGIDSTHINTLTSSGQ